MYHHEGSEIERLRNTILIMYIGAPCFITILAQSTKADKSFDHQKHSGKQNSHDNPLRFVCNHEAQSQLTIQCIKPILRFTQHQS